MPAPAIDRSYHYPPDVLELLVDTIPRLINPDFPDGLSISA